MGHTVTVVASADLIRYALGSAVLFGCFVLVWKLWALKPVEATAAASDETVPGVPLDAEEHGGVNSFVEDLVSGPSEQSAEQPSSTPSPYEADTQHSFDLPAGLPSGLPSEHSFEVSSESALEDLFEITSSETSDLPSAWHIAANDNNAAAVSLEEVPAPEEVLSSHTELPDEQLRSTRHDVELAWGSDEPEWGSDLTEEEGYTAYEESYAPGEEGTNTPVAAVESAYVNSSAVAVEGADEPVALVVESEDAAEEDSTETDAWATATTSTPSETTPSETTPSETTPSEATKTMRSQKRAARRAERVAQLEARRDEARQRRDESRAKRAAKSSKHRTAPAADAAVVALEDLDACETDLAPETEAVTLEAAALDHTTGTAPAVDEVDPFRAAALALLQPAAGVAGTATSPSAATSEVDLSEVDLSEVDLSEEPHAEGPPTPGRRKWRNKQTPAAAQDPEENNSAGAPTPFSIVPFSDTAWDVAVAEEEFIPAAPEPPRLDEWAVAALAETWAQPLPVTPESADPYSIDHHAFGLPEPLPQRRPAAFSS
jgi:hypothetical protein